MKERGKPQESLDRSRSLFKRACALSFVCLLLAVIMLVPDRAYGAPTTNPLKLSVTQEFVMAEGLAANDNFSYCLRALTSGHPMPSAATGDSYTFSLDGNETADLDTIVYSSPGAYSYELAQDIPSVVNKGFTHDDEVYTITVFVEPTLSVFMLIENSAGEKVEHNIRSQPKAMVRLQWLSWIPGCIIPTKICAPTFLLAI